MRDAHPRRAFAHEALAVAVHQDAVAGIGLEQRLGMAMALVLGEGGAGDERLVHVRELGADGRRHALAVTGVAARRADLLDAGKILRHVVGRPVEAAGRQHHAPGGAEGRRLAVDHRLDAGYGAGFRQQALHVGIGEHRAAVIEAAFQQADDEAVAQPDLARDHAPDELGPEPQCRRATDP